MTGSEPKPRSAFHYLLKGVVLILSCGLLVYLLNKLGWKNIVDYGTRLGLVGAGMIIVLGYLENLCDSLALRECLHRKLHPLKALFVNQAGAAVNMFIPFEGGEVLKISLLKKEVGGGNAVAGIVLWGYISKLTKSVGIFVAALVAFLMTTDTETRDTTKILLGLAVLSFVIYLLFRVVLRLGMAEKIIRFLAKVRILRKSADELIEKARSVDTAINTFYREHKKAYWAIFVYQLGARVVNLATLWYLLFLFDDKNIHTALMVYAGINLATFITLIFPNRIGVDEGAGYLLFGFLGLDPALGIMVQFIIRLKNTAITGIALPIAVFGSNRAKSD